MWWFMLYSCEKRYLKDINSYYIYWEIMHLPNFYNNNFLYIVILLRPFAKCSISENECLIRKTKTWQNSHFWFSNLQYFFQISVKNLSSFFHHINFMMFQKVWSKIRKLLSYSAISFAFTNIYWMVHFDRNFL